jgi:homoserine kinase
MTTRKAKSSIFAKLLICGEIPLMIALSKAERSIMTGKKLYKKPDIKEVELQPEQAVLTTCQKGTSKFCLSGAGPTDCYICPIFSS